MGQASISQERIQLIRAFRAPRPGRLQPHRQSLLQAFWKSPARILSRRRLHSLNRMMTRSSISAASILEEPSEDTIKEETPFTEPDDDLCEKITQQVEFYFSDANITKDKFLLKHVKRNKEGFVSLKLISSFKRVKHL